MTVPTEWILTVMIALATVISTLAAMIYRSLSSEIATLRAIVTKLQNDVDRLSKGCGLGTCLYKHRNL
jgi:outer membrane murein-binding lipoprotein Lpp